MKAYLISRIHAILLIVLGLWGYLQSVSPSPTAFIPVVFGALLLMASVGVKREIKSVVITSLVISLAILGGLIMPLKGALGRDDMMALARVVIMLLSTLIAIRYLISALRRKRI